MQPLKIVVFCIFATLIYCVVHDQITASISADLYYLLANTDGSHTPREMALAWGVSEGFRVGAIIGLGVAFAARFGKGQKYSVDSLFRPVCVAMTAVALCSLLAGTIVYSAGFFRPGLFGISPNPDPSIIREEIRFHVANWMNGTSYVAGLLAGLTLMVHIWFLRRRNRVFHHANTCDFRQSAGDFL